jgi:hypothetical protein
MAEGEHVRRCPDCGEEFQLHVVRCSDCGALLEDRLEGEDPVAADDALSGGPGASASPAPPPEAFTQVADGVAAVAAERVGRRLSAAGIPFKLAPHNYRLRVSVRPEDVPAAVAILEREGIVPEQPDPAERPVAMEGGPCPACGTTVASGTLECPGCGLVLGGGPELDCERCGARLVPLSGECPQCGRTED